MNQFEIKQFLKERAGTFFSAKEIASLTNSNEISIYAKLNEISKDRNIVTKTINLGPLNKLTILYSMPKEDAELNETMLEFTTVRNRKEFNGVFHPELITQFMIIKELKKLNKVLDNGSKQQI